jgi:hypothetical protein
MKARARTKGRARTHGRAARLAAMLFLGLASGSSARAQGPVAARTPPAAAVPGALVATVKITIITVPTQKRVSVYWGKKRLGLIAPHQPLILQRPRDSGPMDLIIQCEGFVPVQTRAYTFSDNKLAVKLTPVDQKNTLLGYREEVPPPPPPPPQSDAGAPPGLPSGAPPGVPPAAPGLPAGIAAPPPPPQPDAGPR